MQETFMQETFMQETFMEETFMEETFMQETFMQETFMQETFMEETFMQETFMQETFMQDVTFQLFNPPQSGNAVTIQHLLRRCKPNTTLLKIEWERELDTALQKKKKGGDPSYSSGFCPRLDYMCSPKQVLHPDMTSPGEEPVFPIRSSSTCTQRLIRRRCWRDLVHEN
ncbi:uncharacterized [Tachysurus ichikawai]